MRYIIRCLPWLAIGIKVLGADGDNSILNQTCNAFPCSMLLICVKRVEENIKRNLSKTMSENKSNNILRKIFGTHLCRGLVDCETLQEFEKNVSVLYEELSMDEELKEFASYFKKQKESTIKYHVIKGTVNVCELNDDQGKFQIQVSNSNSRRVYGQVQKNRTAPEKAKVKKLLLNVTVGPKAYTSIMKFKAGDVALDNARRLTKNNQMKRFQQESEEVGDQIVFQQQDDVNSFNLVNEMVEESDHNEFNLNATEFSSQEALPNQKCENIQLSILRSFELISNSHIIPGFGRNQYLVKSYS